MLPPQLNDYSDAWSGFGEPALWSDAAARANDGEVRMLMLSPLHHNNRAIIRIDRSKSGRAFGYFILGERIGRNQWIVAERRRFVVSYAQLQHLDSVIAQSNLWQNRTEFWMPVDDQGAETERVCIDGVEVLLERVDQHGYRFSEANVQCAAPRGFFAVTEELMAIAGADQLRWWLR